MESRFGEDFRSVRIHSNQAANAAASSRGAAALTRGDHIILGDHSRRWDSRLIAHELAHVVQQRRGGPAPGKGHEADADRAADAAMSGRHARVALGSAQAVQAQELSEDEIAKQIEANRARRNIMVLEPAEHDRLDAEYQKLVATSAQHLDAEVEQNRKRRNIMVLEPAEHEKLDERYQHLLYERMLLQMALVGTANAPLILPHSPFARPLLPTEWAQLRQSGQAIHMTAPGNAAKIGATPGEVSISPSRGWLRNLTTPGGEESAYFFRGQPSRLQFFTNLLGRGPMTGQAQVSIAGEALPSSTLLRPWDNTLVVPGGYKGPGTVTMPGEIAPPLPIGGTRGAAIEPVRRTGVGSGMLSGVASLALMGLSMYGRCKKMESDLEETGYAPVGPSAYAHENRLFQITRFLMGSGLEMATATEPVIDIPRHRAHVRSKLESKTVGERITFNWQAYGAGSFGSGVQDVPCVYEKQEGGSWKLISCEDPPAMFQAPSLTRMLDPAVSDESVRSMLLDPPTF